MVKFVHLSPVVVVVLSIQYADTRNVALGKPAYQTDTYFDNVEYLSAERAVDGNTSADNSCSHTSSFDAVWSVDLGDIYQVSSVTIYNRNDQRARLQNVEVYLGVEKDGPYSLVGFHEGAVGASYTFTLPSYSQARYVNITRNPPYQQLTLCEVEVEGRKKGSTFAAYPMSKYQDNTPVVTHNNVRSPIGCAYACYSSPECRSTNYNAADLTCELLGTPLEEAEDASSEYTALKRIG
ncbi:fucolectin-like [Mya arenaria]|uniref:fucolectin-like n=1 Tax=Mya arenaria TaxID=6604 RepID=UPI0022E2F759|nr:fucolectin-like [Mya arenaria]